MEAALKQFKVIHQWSELDYAACGQSDLVNLLCLLVLHANIMQNVRRGYF